MAKVLIPIPTRDFDPTEVAIPWRALLRQGHEGVFATPDGRPGRAEADVVAADRGRAGRGGGVQ